MNVLLSIVDRYQFECIYYTFTVTIWKVKDKQRLSRAWQNLNFYSVFFLHLKHFLICPYDMYTVNSCKFPLVHTGCGTTWAILYRQLILPPLKRQSVKYDQIRIITHLYLIFSSTSSAGSSVISLTSSSIFSGSTKLQWKNLQLSWFWSVIKTRANFLSS
jgi:hypothetical protein